MEDKTIHYRKLRATSHWLLQTLVQCMLVWSVANTLVLIVNRYVNGFHIPKNREYIAYALLIFFYILIRFPNLISRYEAIEKGKARTKQGGYNQKNETNARFAKVNKLPPLVTNPELTLLIREYKRKKILSVALYCCSGLAIILGFTSLFFLLFVYDFSPLKSNPVPELDQFILPIMMACVTTFYTIRVIIFRLSKLDEQLVSKVTALKQSIEKNVPIEKAISPLGFPPEIMDGDNHLVVSMAAFVRHCVENGLYDPYTIEAWRPIDGLVYNAKGKPISAKQLAQSYQDQLMKGTIMPPHTS